MAQPSEVILPVVHKEKALFFEEVVQGLKSKKKYLPSKYFYDKKGDILFQKIMQCEEYYLTDCELEILKQQSGDIVKKVKQRGEKFDLIGLGAGDGSKAIFLIAALLKEGVVENYFPVDISGHVIEMLEEKLPKRFPGLSVKGFNGEYMEMLREIETYSSRPKMTIFLGSNIGNFQPEQAVQFCQQLHHSLQLNDLIYIGFDLKKHPQTILNAYNDKQGFTKAFNLNILARINRELDADFQIADFEHYPTYDPDTGTCKSYLISLKNQTVCIGEEKISFQENEPIHTEVSQKYSVDDIKHLACQTGFEQVAFFSDTKKWFLDALWVRK